MPPALNLKPSTESELEAIADALVESGNYRVQGRLQRRARMGPPTGTELTLALSAASIGLPAAKSGIEKAFDS